MLLNTEPELRNCNHYCQGCNGTADCAEAYHLTKTVDIEPLWQVDYQETPFSRWTYDVFKREQTALNFQERHGGVVRRIQ